MDFFEFVIALVAIGGTFVTIWVALLYRRKEKTLPEVAQAHTLAELSSLAGTMEQRISTLEDILDAEVPGWRDQNEQSR